MDQQSYEIITGLLNLWKIILQLILFFMFWTAAFHEKREKGSVLAAALFVFLNIGMGFWMSDLWSRYAVSAFLVLGYCMIHSRKQLGKAVFVLLAFYNFHCLSYLTANSIYAEAINRMMRGLDMWQPDYEQQMYGCIAVGVVLLVFCYTILFALMGTVYCILIKEAAVMAWQDVVLLSVLNFVGSMMTNAVIELYAVEVDQGVFRLFDEKPDLLWKMPVIAVFIFAGEATLIYFWQRHQILLLERQRHFAEEQQVKAMKKRLEEAEHFYGSIRKVRHEMKNHMMNLKGLAEVGQYAEIEEYVRKMDATIQELEYKYTTGNAVTDVILNDKWHRAERAGIRFEAEFWYGGEIPVFDLGIILNNLLDNAIEACEKLEPGKGFIRLTLKRRKQFLLLDVENSFDGVLQESASDKQAARQVGSFPQTTKQTSLPGIVMEHGIGLQNVRDIAERYFGRVSIKTEGNLFRVTVMLQQGNEAASKTC